MKGKPISTMALMHYWEWETELTRKEREMKGYIERKALIDKIFPIGLVDDGRYALPAKAVKTAIDNAPVADVVEVVRCKDCKHYSCERSINHHECNIFNGAYETVGYPTMPDDYCSYGERKEI